MTVRIDPEQTETRVLFDFVDLDGKQVLEIGSGDGRLTWLFADRAAHVTAVEPFTKTYSVAMQNLPEALKDKVEFQNISFEDFAAQTDSATYDVAILSWSLC